MEKSLVVSNNLLVCGFPGSVNISGQSVPINTDFRVGIQFELLMQNENITAHDKISRALLMYYGGIPRDIKEATDKMLWFYRCGREPEEDKSKKRSKTTAKAYDFEQDADMLLASFWQYYGIDLTAVGNMHWWAFRALMRGLPPESEFRCAVGYRTMSLNGLSKNEKKRYAKLKEIYALKNKKSVNSVISLEERNQRMRDYIAKRFAETERGVTSPDE